MGNRFHSGERIAKAAVLHAIYGQFPTFAPVLFHIFFHSCGKLRGETLRECFTRSRGTDCNMSGFRIAIDTLGSPSLLFKFLLRGVYRHEGQTYISAEPAAPEENPRVSRADVYEERPPGPEAPARQGPQAAGRHAFTVTTESPWVFRCLRAVAFAGGRSSNTSLTAAGEHTAVISRSWQRHRPRRSRGLGLSPAARSAGPSTGIVLND